MDKTWTTYERSTEKYREGVREFIQFAKIHARNPDKIICPCAKCKNLSSKTHEDLYGDLVIYEFDPLYRVWVLHGEKSNFSEDTSSNMSGAYNVEENAYSNVSGTYRMFRDIYASNENGAQNAKRRVLDDLSDKFEAAQVPLYSTCNRYTKLTATMTLYECKAENGISDKGFNDILKIIRGMLPDDNTLPDSLNTVKKFLKDFNLGYEKIDACVNDCCLFRKENATIDTCPKCKASRWKLTETNEVQKGVSAKVLRYFPIVPRIRRMFSSFDKANQLRWHFSHRSDNGKMRHPVDSFAWKSIDKKWPNFASEPRNIRFGLATDGFNPFKSLSSKYSCWPIILVMYNLPPEICMSYENLMLTLLIPGPSQPGNDIDVYLQPLIDDLKELWDNGI